MNNVLRTLQAAFITFTRLPLTFNKLEAPHFQLAHYYLPFVGLVVGLISAGIFQTASIYFSPLTATIMVIFAGILATGALHEDGFADCCDGFGAGHNAESILAIMKDSRLGSYGVLGVMGLISLKITLLNDIIIERQPLALVLMHILGRINPLLIMATLPRTTLTSAKMTRNLQKNNPLLIIMLLLVMFCLFITAPLPLVFILFTAVISVFICCKIFFARKLNGYNGDCLGACEQITECAILFCLALYY